MKQFGRSHSAISGLLRALDRDPDDTIAQSKLIALLTENSDTDRIDASSRKHDLLAAGNLGEQCDQSDNSRCGQLIIGIGTGRSGSTSLVKFLQAQHGAFVSHERPPRLPWVPNTQRLEVHLRWFESLTAAYSLVGDVSHWWLPYLQYVFEANPDVKVVALQRDREQTIKSFEKLKGFGEAKSNHWNDHMGVGWRQNVWDECYPSYATKDRFEAIGHYWDAYYETVKEWNLRKPDQFFLAHILNSREGQDEWLTFLGVRDPVYSSTEIRYNQGGSTADGVGLWSQ